MAAVKFMVAAGILEVTYVPVLFASRTLLRVVVPVELDESAVEFQTAASEVKSAAPLLPLGADGEATGHASYPEVSSLFRPKVSEPTK